jgi:hypothetical protein
MKPAMKYLEADVNMSDMFPIQNGVNRSQHLCPPVLEWPSYSTRHRVAFPSPSTTRRITVEVS